MTVGTPGNDDLRNDPFADPELVDAQAGDDLITIIIPARTVSTITVEGDEGFDVLTMQADSFVPTGTIGWFGGRSGGFAADIFYSGIERLVLTGGLIASGQPFVTGDSEDWLTFISSSATQSGPGVRIVTNGGNDRVVLLGSQTLTVVDVGAGNDFVDVRGASPNAGRSGAIEILGGDGDDILIGGNHRNIIYGGAGNDLLVSSDNNGTIHNPDQLFGGTGNDIYQIGRDQAIEQVVEGVDEGIDEIRFNGFTYVMPANVENLTSLNGLGPVTNFTGNELDNVIVAGDSTDTFRMHLGGNDTVLSGGENDRIFFGAALTAGDQVDGGSDTDLVAVQGLTVFSLLPQWLVGIEQFHILSGLDDTYGTAGSTPFSYDVMVTDATLSAGQVLTIVATTLRANETLTFNGSAETNGAFAIRGGAGNDDLTGGALGDLLDGSGGDDRLVGGGGNDIYHVDLTDQIVELSGQGYDSVYARSDYRLGAGVAVELLATLDYRLTAPLILEGNEFSQEIIGNDGNNILRGEGGDDTLRGLGGNDSLFGGAGTDTLDGGEGADTLAGGADNDSYYIDNPGDVIVEAAGEGYDYVYSSGSFQLKTGSHVELLGTTNSLGMAAIVLVGNEYNNALVGNNGHNELVGGAGDDSLQGLEGNDHLRGGAGNDYMIGGLGDDLYYVDSTFDTTIELAGEGYDQVYSSVDLALRAGSEIELFATADYLATTNLSLTGNEFGQQIVGNAGANVIYGLGGVDYLLGLSGTDILDGGEGADIMDGGADNDSYHVDHAGDLVWEAAGAGYDYVYSSVSYTLAEGHEIELLGTRNYLGTEVIDLTGNGTNNELVGNAGANVLRGMGGFDYLYGLEGADTLDGGGGLDFLTGGAGADIFLFSNALDSKVNAADRIFDFLSGTDKIDLSLIDANETVAGDQGFAFIGTGAFTNKAGELRYEQVGNEMHLFGDTNGDGIADLEIVVNGSTIVTSDFIF